MLVRGRPAGGVRQRPARGGYLAADRARVAERCASVRYLAGTPVLLTALFDNHRELRVLAPDGRSDAQRGIESVQHHIRPREQRARLPVHDWAGSRVVAWTRAERDVDVTESRRLDRPEDVAQ